jgi:hypothetical protein
MVRLSVSAWRGSAPAQWTPLLKRDACLFVRACREIVALLPAGGHPHGRQHRGHPHGRQYRGHPHGRQYRRTWRM